MAGLVIDLQEDAMRHQPEPLRRRRRAGRTLALAVALAVPATALAACSSGSGSDGARADAPAAARSAARRKANEAYLLSIKWEQDQAECVSRKTSVDIADLLSGTDGSGLPTEKPGFDDFATAVRTCIRQDTALSTTTVPPG
ncbi:hypothetical protein KSP35_02115 [Aquihabitans sp. G128]|uniref:hypothetical protein n=1 Tax=Aquihabitans sp. G128 TaxID=2849779 RepID=UPI001C23E544|nr:hypothetical protein [Aquihabitans sp. G128]QXC61666.1 hypothetical protein KSP35_02115 [Aquihabitans sp. G128]